MYKLLEYLYCQIKKLPQNLTNIRPKNRPNSKMSIVYVKMSIEMSIELPPWTSGEVASDAPM